MFGPRMGTWYVSSKEDPRWNKTGRAMGFVSGGGPQEMRDWIQECRRKYGPVPDDATWSFYKD